MSDLETLKDRLHELHGHRMCVVEQHLSEGDVREAALAQGESNGLRTAIAVVEELQDGFAPDTGDRELHYHALSKQRFEVTNAVTVDSDPDDHRGWQ